MLVTPALGSPLAGAGSSAGPNLLFNNSDCDVPIAFVAQSAERGPEKPEAMGRDHAKAPTTPVRIRLEIPNWSVAERLGSALLMRTTGVRFPPLQPINARVAKRVRHRIVYPAILGS